MLDDQLPRVLIAQANCGNYFLEWVRESPAQWVMDLPWQTLRLDSYPQLLVIEELNTFYHCFEPAITGVQLPESLANALIIYRGGELESAACKALRQAFLQEDKSCILWAAEASELLVSNPDDYSHYLLRVELAGSGQLQLQKISP